MANDKKFIVKNGLLTQETVVIGSTFDNGVDKLQVSGSSLFTQGSSATPTISITNTGGTGNSIIAQFVGDSDSLQILNIGTGDYALVNSQQNNGIRFHDGTSGLEILYNGSVDLDFNSTGIDFKREPTYNGSVFWNANNDGSGSGLDADLLDGLDSLQFLRSDEDDTFNGNLIITGDLTVQGTTTTINTETILLADNIITLNSNFTSGTPTENSGWEVLRGSEATSSVQWDESNDWFKLISAGTDLGRIITTADEGSGNGFDADTVDGLEAAQFLRSDADDTATGNIIFQGTITVGNNTNAGATIIMDGEAGNRYIYSNNGEIGFLNSAFAYAAYSDGLNNWRVLNDTYAKRFVDADNNAYLLDPAGNSVLNTIDVEGQIRHNGDTDTYLNFNAADSFEVRTGGSQRLLVNNTAVTAVNQMRSPIYYDNDDITYYGDFASTSRLNDISLVGQIIHDGDTNTYLDFNAADSFQVVTGGSERLTVTNTAVTGSVDFVAPRFVDSNNTSFFANPAGTSLFADLNVYSGTANGQISVGSSATERFEIVTTPGQGYIRYYQDETNATDHSVNFEIVSSGLGLNRFNFNRNINVGSNSVSGAFGVFSSGVYGSVFYDYEDELFYADLNSTDVSIRVAGEIIAGNGSLATPTYSFNSDTNTGMYRYGSDIIGFSAGGNDEFRIYSTYAQAVGQMRSPIYYDSNNTAYYGDFASTSNMNRIDIDDYIRHRGDTDTYFGFAANDTFRVWTAGTQRLNIDNDSADFAVNVYAPIFYDSNNNAYYGDFAGTSNMSQIDIDDYIRHRGNTTSYFGFSANNIYKLFTNNVERLNIDNDSADFSVNVYAPRYYDSNNNAYYGDFASTSVLNNIGIDTEIFHNGDTDTKLAFTTDAISLETGGTSRVDVNNTYVAATNEMRAPIYYDTTQQTDYLDLGATGANDTLRIRGRINVGGGTDANRADDATGNGGITIAPYQGYSATSNPTLEISGGNGGYALASLNRIDLGFNPLSGSNRFLSFLYDGVEKVSYRGDAGGNFYVTLAAGAVWSTMDTGGTFGLSATDTGEVIIGDQSTQYANPDATTNFIATPDANRLHVNGSLQLNGASNILAISAADAGNTAINESTFLAVNELGFSAGGGFFMDETTTIKIRGNKALLTTGTITGGDIYASRFYDADNNAYYVDPNGDSQLNTIDIDDYIRHRGDLTTYMGFDTNAGMTFVTGGTERFNLDNDSADFSVNVYAPRYYDSNNNAYYGDFASTSIMSRIDLDDYIRHRGDTDNYFGFPSNDNFRVVTANVQRFNININGADFAPPVRGQLGTLALPAFTFTSDTDTGMYRYADNTLGFSAGGNDEFRIFTTYAEAVGQMRAPIYYDSNNTAFYLDPAATSITSIMRANQFQVDGSTYIIDSPSGDYGTIKVEGAVGGTWAGYAIRDDWVFMADGATNAGIYNDTDNEWAIQFTRNAGTDLLFNGGKQAETENGYFLATNQMRAPIYYAPSSTSYWLDLDVGNTSDALRIPGRINRQGFATGNGASNIFLTAQDRNHFIWNTATNWGIFWATDTGASYRYAPFGDNMITFVGAGNTRAAIDLDNGNAYFQGEVFASNFQINGGNENLGLLKTYGSGLGDPMLFDATEYWEKRVIQPMQGVENNATTTTAEYVKNNNGPFASSYALRSAAYRTFDSDYIPVEPGEQIYGEIAARFVSGSGGLLYMGVRRYDKDKNPIAGNDGIEYFVASAVNVTSTGWTTYRGHTTIPTSHTPFGGSDGGGCKYVRVIVLMNYSAGGALREFGPPVLKRANQLSNIVTQNIDAEGDVYANRYYDRNNAAFYVDPASTSIMNIVDASNFRDRDNTAYFMNPLTGGKVAGTWDWTNGTIDNLNNLSFNDPGPNEGIHWKGGNNWRIYESPDDLTTNSAGNLQILYNNNQLGLRINTSGDGTFGRYAYAQRFYDSNNGSFYLDPASTSVLNQILLSNSEPLRFSTTSTALFDHEGNSTNVAFQMNKGGSTLSDSSSFGVLQLSRTNHNNGATGAGAGLYFVLKDSAGTQREYAGIYGRKTVAGTGGGELVFMNYARNEVAYLNSDYFYHNSDIRSPIFYDSNDTNYYVDIASTSNMNIVRAQQLQLDGSTYIIDSPSGDYGSIRVDGAKNGWAGYAIRDDWAFMSSGAGNAGIYNDTNNQWAILAAQQSDVQIYFNGTWEERSRSGYMEARGSYRAPIFYDSNNTAYRIDGNGTSRLLTLQVDNVIQGSVNGYAETLLRTDNRIISPSEDPAGRMRFGFTSWDNNNTQYWADYLHLRSYTDASGGSDNLVMFRKTGIAMRIWQQTWNSTTAYSTVRNVALYNEIPAALGGNTLYASIFYDSDDTSYRVDPNGTSTVKQMRVAANTLNASYPYGAIEVREYNYAGAQTDNYATAPRIAFHWGGRVASQIALASNGEIRVINNPGTTTENFRSRISYADDSHRSPIFYDSNNTTYRGDFASTSILNVLDVRGEVYNDGWFRNDTNGRGLYSTPNAMHWYADSNARWRLESTQSTAQILFATSGNAARGYVYADNSNQIGFLSQDGNWALRTTTGVVESYRNFYAPIMYDRNNSGYYVDPASTSQLNLLYVDSRIIFNGGASTDDLRGLFFDGNGNGGSQPYAIFRENGAWTFPYPDLRIAFHTGIKFGANASYQGMRFYTDYDMSSQVMSINNANDPLGGANVYVNNSLQAGSSLRAQLFYDSNNTAYYMDPATINGSRFEGVNSRTMSMMGLSGQTRSSKEYYAARPRITGDTNYWTGSMGWGRIDMNTLANWGSGFIDSWSSPPNQPSGTSHWVGVQAEHYTNGASQYGWQLVGGPIANLRLRNFWPGFGAWRTVPVLGVNDNNGAAMYASIYYDANNTGYYCDPSSFSNFNTGVRATDVYARNWLRADNSGYGLYNGNRGTHFYSSAQNEWRMAGNNASLNMSLRGFAAYESTSRFWIYGDTSGWQGFLNSAGSWKFRFIHSDGYSPGVRFEENGDESWTGNVGADVGKIEYHANRFYIVSGSNSDRIVQFRRDGTDRSYIANDGVFVGTATSARWADLAERYEADAIYEAGTVLAIGGDKEVTLYQPGMPLAGAISVKPAYRMNDDNYGNDDSIESKMNPFIALKGRIPVKINGSAKKGQWIIADKDGKGRAVDYGTPGINSFDIIGIALEDGADVVEVKI